MKKRISRLNDELVNQIAAGEVVERPASVIKELVENSLDAKSTKVDVRLIDGGIGEIAIIDDGEGIHPEDLFLSIERHATSKIRALEDLQTIGSYGFRGEALAAVSSVADIEIRSRTQDAVEATVLESRMGELLPLRPLGSPPGTSIFVRKLFARIPARLKFLRSSGTEFSYCSKLFKELALGAPEVTLSLSHNGKTVSRFLATNPGQRVQEVLKPFWEPIQITEVNDGLNLNAFLSPPDLFQDRGELFIYINQRIVRSKLFASAVRNAYLEILGEHHDPSGAVFLTIQPDWVDVNVHPQKLEVRCLKQDRIYQWLFATVRKNLAALYTPLPEDLSLSDLSHPQSFYSQADGSQILSVFQDRFFLRENQTGIEIVNRVELNSRIWMNRLQTANRFTANELPVPRILNLALGKWKTTLSRLGIEIEDYGNGDTAVTTFPDFLEETELNQVLGVIAGATSELEVLQAVAQNARRLPMEMLLEELKKQKEGFTQEPGKPILWRMPFELIEKHFE